LGADRDVELKYSAEAENEERFAYSWPICYIKKVEFNMYRV
jgi:hypothetical protein